MQINPNKTELLTKKLLHTFKDGKVLKRNCSGPINTLWRVDEKSKNIEIADGVTEGQFEAAHKMIQEFWVNFRDLGIQADHPSPYVSNLHLVLTITNVMMDICDDDPRLESEMGLAIYKFCKKIVTIIQLGDNKGGLVQ
jgi:hypothetical protein